MDSSDDGAAPAGPSSSSGGEEGGGRGGLGLGAGGGRRPRTRDDAWLGEAWDDGDSDGGGGGRRRRKRGRLQSEEGSEDEGGGGAGLRPVGFVPGGGLNDDVGDNDDASAGARGGLGSRPSRRDGEGAGHAVLGARGGGGGLGFRAGAADDDDDQPARPGLGGGGGGGLGWAPPDTAAEDDGLPHLPGEFGRRVTEGARRRREAEAAARVAAAGGGGAATTGRAPPAARPPPPAADIGTFEKHTRGIGAKLLGKMGYTPGAGLGRAGQGIARPVEAVARAGRAGMGFGPRGEPKPPSVAQRPAAAPPPKEKPKAPPAPRLWRAKDRDARERRAATRYVTPSEAAAAAAGGGAAPPSSVGPILDLTGPQARLRTGPGAGAPVEDEDGAADAALPLPELQHNLRLLTDLAGADAASHDGRARAAAERGALLERERERAGRAVAVATADADRLAGLVRGAEAAAAAAAAALAAADPPTPAALLAANASAAAAWASLKDAHPSHYTASGLPSLAAVAALPILAALLGPASAWSPLDDPDPGPAVRAALAWRPLTEAAGHGHGGKAAVPLSNCAYARLVRATALPALSSALVRGWEPREPGPALALVEAWAPALPSSADRAALHSAVILPRLAAAVAAWDPTTDPVPVHAWLHPWLPMLGAEAMAGLWPPLRHRLGSALSDWHPSDGSAAALLRPWRTVFASRDWDALMRRAIAPKLAWAVGEGGPLDLNPGAPDPAAALAPWHWALSWEPLLGAAPLAALLAAHFFPRWRAVLATWLAAPGCDPDEVTAWHAGWVALVPPALAAQAPVRAALAAGLTAIHRGGVVEGEAVPPVPPPAPVQGEEAAVMGEDEDEDPSLSFRDQLEAAASAAGLPLLLPAPGGRRHDGRPVLLCGRVPLVLDAGRGMLLMQKGGAGGGVWVPASLEDLAGEVKRREVGKVGK